MKGKLFVVSGPSGVGKNTILNRVVAGRENVQYSISATSRAKRPGEIDGKSYFFVTREQFEAMLQQGELLEYAEYVGNYYGTPEGPVNAMLEQGMDVILEIEVQGALIVKAKRPDAHLIFIAPPSFEVLENRLRGRGTEAPEVVSMRLEKARGECARMEDYDYIVVNDRLEEAVQDLAAILRASRCRSELVDFQLV